MKTINPDIRCSLDPSAHSNPWCFLWGIYSSWSKKRKKVSFIFTPTPSQYTCTHSLLFSCSLVVSAKMVVGEQKDHYFKKQVKQVKKISFRFFVKLISEAWDRFSTFPSFMFFYFFLGVSLLWRKYGCPKGRLHWFSSIEHCFLSKYLSYLSQSLLEFLCLSFVLWFWFSP